MRRLLACMLVAAGAAPAQSLRVYSEFQRIGPFGGIVPADRSEKPREILSPAVARNAYASFHLTVEVPPGSQYELHVGQYPEKAVRVALYKELYSLRGGTWIPDRLERVALPYTGQMPDEAQTIKAQKAQSFWLDLWVARDRTVERIKVEPQMYAGGTWLVYPMEVRVISTVVPNHEKPPGRLPPATEPADAAALGPLKSFLCGVDEGAAVGQVLTVRQLIRRNALQDMGLVRTLEASSGKESVAKGLLKPLGVTDWQQWCASPETRGPLGAEWYLRARDFLYRSTAH